MKKPVPAIKRNGFTLIELMVASMLMALTVSLIFMSWGIVSRHIAVGQRKSGFEAEATRVAQQLLLELRRSPEVITVASNRISFLAANGADTIDWALGNGNLIRNGRRAAIALRRPGAGDSMVIETGADPTGSGPMLGVALRMENGFGDTSAIALKVRVAMPRDRMDSLEASRALGRPGTLW